MIIYRVFDEVFSSWSHVAVLRALLDTTNGFTGNETSRIAGMSRVSSLKALTSLETLGIVRRQRGGRDHIFTLNRDHWLVKEAIIPLYEEERKFRKEIFSAIAHIVKKYVISAVIFGSVARNEETPESDFDLCCIVHFERDKEKVRDVLHRAASTMYKEFGIKLAPVFFTIREFRTKSHARVVLDIVKEGKVLAGANPKVILNG